MSTADDRKRAREAYELALLKQKKDLNDQQEVISIKIRDQFVNHNEAIQKEER